VSEPAGPEPTGPQQGGLELTADCRKCFGLCCVALPFSASADFAIDKRAGQPCVNLAPDFGCGIHSRLRPAGFSGCTVYDCFGAGQHVAQETFAGVDWKRRPQSAELMFAVFPVMRQLHELLWYLTEAVRMPVDATLRVELSDAAAHIERLTRRPADEFGVLDVAEPRRTAHPLLARTSEVVRSQVPQGKSYQRADLIGARLAGADLRGADLRGALLIGADLRGADLRLADLLGADLRATEFRAANLTGALFLTQSQLNAANGDAGVELSAPLVRPAHWPG